MTHRHQTARRLPWGRLLALLAVLPLASCVRLGHPNGTTYCGTHIPSGANSVAFSRLDPNAPAPVEPAPAVSLLPKAAAVPRFPQAEYVQTSPACDHGAVVVVTPTDAAQLTVAVRAADGTVTGVGLQHITARVTVAAWQRGTYLGAIALDPPGTG